MVPSDEELLKDYSVLKTCVSKEVAQDALAVFNKAINTGTLSMADRDLSDEAFMRMLKAVGIFGKLKNMLPNRTSVLPITEVDLSGNNLVTFTPHAVLGTPEVSQRSLQPLQLTVQFVRVSTDAKIIRLEHCNLQGTSHDKDDKIEQEVIRLVKKFGAGREARFATEVSLAGNKFESDFTKKIIEAAYWERARHPDKDNLPRLHLNLRRNRIRTPRKVVEELRAGQNAGGTILVASVEEPANIREKALIVVDLADQVDRSVTPIKGQRIVAGERARNDRHMRLVSPARRASPRRPSRRFSPPARRSMSPGAQVLPAVQRRTKTRSRSRRGRQRQQAKSSSRSVGKAARGHREGSRGCLRSGRRDSRSHSKHREADGSEASESYSSEDEDSRDEDDECDDSCSPSPTPVKRRLRRGSRMHDNGRRRRRRSHHHRRGAGHRRRRRPRKRNLSPDSRYSDSRSPSPCRRGGRKRRRR